MMKKWFLPISDVAYQAYDDAKRAQERTANDYRITKFKNTDCNI